MDALVGHCENFVCDSLFYWKPMELTKEGRGMVMLLSAEHQLCCSVLSSLQAIDI